MNKIKVIYSPYALEVPRYIPGIGIIARDRNSIEQWIPGIVIHGNDCGDEIEWLEALYAL